jgi:hypothetical protein
MEIDMDLTGYTTPQTVQDIYQHYVTKRKQAHRPHLGGSQIGNPCARALWYQFRHMDSPVFDGRTLRIFETGDREENRLIENLRAVGVTVWDRDPDTGRQINFTECGGHFALSLDGVGQDFKESGQPHTLEFKTMNDKNFKALQKDGVEKSKPVYWAQCQIGMHLADLDRCAFIAVNKNTDEIYMERIKRDLAAGLQLVAKAQEVIFSDKPPAKLNNDPSFYLCKFCDYRHVCHEGKPPEVNCRTCAHATPEVNGTWSCAKVQPFGAPCVLHLFNPYAMPWEVHDATPDWVEYVTSDGELIRNEKNSDEIAASWMPF